MISLNLYAFFSALACERIFIKTHCIERRLILFWQQKVYCFRHVPTLFSPETLQAGAVKGLTPPTYVAYASRTRTKIV